MTDTTIVSSAPLRTGSCYEGAARLTKGYVIKEEYPSKAVGRMQAFVPNLRREKFRDPRVRQALNLAFDFETTNKNAFFGLYERIGSYYAGTELASSGLPQGKELEILNEVKADLPPEVFTTEFKNPVGATMRKCGRTIARHWHCLRRQAGH